MTSTPTPARADGQIPTRPVRAARGTLAPGSAGRAAPDRSPVAGAARLSSPQRRERAAAAETPGPETAPSPPLGNAAVRARVKTPAPASRAAHLDRAPAPGRVPDKMPTGGTLASSQATSVPPAGSTRRTWTLELPAGMELLSLNGREHWAARNRKTQALKQAAWVLAKRAKIPQLGRAAITVEYQPPDRRRRDADNTCAASGKACADGLVLAGVLEDDECPRYVTGIWCTIGERYPRGRLVLHITEVATAGESA